MTCVDRELDKSTSENHDFLKNREQLVDMKIENPALRLTNKNNPFSQPTETFKTHEKETFGIIGPKTKFLHLDAYERRWGKPPPEKIKTIKYKGQNIVGVDIIID